MMLVIWDPICLTKVIYNTELYKTKAEQVPLLGYNGDARRQFLFHLKEC